MKSLKKLLVLGVAVCGVSLFSVAARAEDKAEDNKTMSGVLIDNHCGEGKDEAAAAKHPVKCSLKDACAESGYSLVVGDKHYALDDKSNEKAKDYLKEADSNKVTVEGKVDGEKLTVASIKKTEDEKK